MINKLSLSTICADAFDWVTYAAHAAQQLQLYLFNLLKMSRLIIEQLDTKFLLHTFPTRSRDSNTNHFTL